MPIWEFNCNECGEKFEIYCYSLAILEASEKECTKCKSRNIKRKYSRYCIDCEGIVMANERVKRELWTKGAKIR